MAQAQPLKPPLKPPAPKPGDGAGTLKPADGYQPNNNTYEGIGAKPLQDPMAGTAKPSNLQPKLTKPLDQYIKPPKPKNVGYHEAKPEDDQFGYGGVFATETQGVYKPGLPKPSTPPHTKPKPHGGSWSPGPKPEGPPYSESKPGNPPADNAKPHAHKPTLSATASGYVKPPPAAPKPPKPPPAPLPQPKPKPKPKGKPAAKANNQERSSASSGPVLTERMKEVQRMHEAARNEKKSNKAIAYGSQIKKKILYHG